MAVDAVVGNIQLAADEPFGVGWLPIEGPGVALEPMQKLGLLVPEFLGVIRRALVKFAVFLERLDMGVFAEFGRRRNCLFVKEMRVEISHGLPSGDRIYWSFGGRPRNFPVGRPYHIQEGKFGQVGFRDATELKRDFGNFPRVKPEMQL